MLEKARRRFDAPSPGDGSDGALPPRFGLALVVFATFATLAQSALAQAPTERDLLPYAVEKSDSAARTPRSGAHFAYPGDLPAHGMLLATGNILSPRADWIIIDLDALSLREATTELQASIRGERPVAVISEEKSRRLTIVERDTVVVAANAIWKETRETVPLPQVITDALCSVALLDGNEVLHEFGSACPRPRFAELLQRMAEAEGGPPKATGSPGDVHDR